MLRREFIKAATAAIVTSSISSVLPFGGSDDKPKSSTFESIKCIRIESDTAVITWHGYIFVGCWNAVYSSPYPVDLPYDKYKLLCESVLLPTHDKLRAFVHTQHDELFWFGEHLVFRIYDTLDCFEYVLVSKTKQKENTDA